MFGNCWERNYQCCSRCFSVDWREATACKFDYLYFLFIFSLLYKFIQLYFCINIFSFLFVSFLIVLCKRFVMFIPFPHSYCIILFFLLITIPILPCVCVLSFVRQKGMGWRKLGIYGNRTGPKTLANFVSRLDQTEPTKEDPKTRRRRLYRLDSNNKPPFPFQARNFHAYVMENKEIIKTLSLLSGSTQPIKEVW